MNSENVHAQVMACESEQIEGHSPSVDSRLVDVQGTYLGSTSGYG